MKLIASIVEFHRISRGIYGVPRVHGELRLRASIRIGRKRMARLMRDAGLAGGLPPPHEKLHQQ